VIGVVPHATQQSLTLVEVHLCSRITEWSVAPSKFVTRGASPVVAIPFSALLWSAAAFVFFVHQVFGSSLRLLLYHPSLLTGHAIVGDFDVGTARTGRSAALKRVMRQDPRQAIATRAGGSISNHNQQPFFRTKASHILLERSAADNASQVPSNTHSRTPFYNTWRFWFCRSLHK